MQKISKKLLLSSALIGTVFVFANFAQAEEQKSETVPVSAPAPQMLTALSREVIEAFYNEAVAAQMGKIDQTVAFLKKHVHEQAVNKMKIISRVPGAQTASEELTLDKRQLILKTKEGAHSTKVKSLKTKIISVELLEEGRKAKVKDTSYGVSLVRMASPYGGASLMEAEQSMFCDDELVLSGDGVIQILNSQCNIEVSLEEKK